MGRGVLGIHIFRILADEVWVEKNVIACLLGMISFSMIAYRRDLNDLIIFTTHNLVLCVK